MANANATAAVPDLWSLARDRLDVDDRRMLDHSGGTGGNGLEIVRNLQSLTDRAIQESINKRWRIAVPGKVKKTIIVRDLLGKLTKWLDTFVKVGDAAMQYDPTHAALPWAGVRFLLQIARNDFDKFGFVLEGTELIARVIGRSAIFENLYLSDAYQASDKLQESLLQLYTTILVYLSKAQGYYRQNTPRRVLGSTFNIEDSFKELLESIDTMEPAMSRYSTLIDTEIRNDTAHRVRGLSLASRSNHEKMKELLNKMTEPISRISRSLATIEDHLEQSKRLEILDWISTQPYTSYHRQACSGVLSGTGQWLLNDSSFVHWQNESASSLFWLHGFNGTGKTKLVSIAVDNAMRRHEDGLAALPAYYYCSRNAAEPERSNPEVVLASIARQLACSKPGSPVLPPAEKNYQDARLTGSLQKHLDLDKSCELILQLVDYHDITTIVIDALDECDKKSRGRLIQILQRILQDAQSLVKVFVSSRDDGDIKLQLQDYPHLMIESGKNFDDISAFVTLETEGLIRSGRLLPYSKAKDELKDLIITEVIEKANGMFRWVTMQLEHLCDAVLDEDLREILGRLPLELSELYSELYDKMLARKGPASTAIIRNSLRWLLSSRSPLKSLEFRKAISGNTNICLDDISNDQILDLLHNFLVLDRELDVFRFAHLSVVEYLEGSRPEYSRNACHALAAEICLIEMIQSSRCTDVGRLFRRLKLDVRNTASETPKSYVEGLHKYALKMWASHSEWAGEEQRTLDSRFKELFCFFLLDDCGEQSPLNAWVRSRLRKRVESVASKTLRDLVRNHSTSLARSYFLACAHGFCEIVRMSLTDSHFMDGMRRIGLRLAAQHDQERVWKLLLGSDEIETALMEKMVKRLSPKSLTWLLKASPKTKITNRILVAANRTNGEIMTLLLDHCKDLTVTEEIIASASWVADASALEVLLSRAKDCEITAKALSRAARWGDTAVVKLLLRVGSHRCINSEVLAQAARSGDEATLRLLLDSAEETDINEETMEQAVTLCFSYNGETVRILLEYGGKVTQCVILRAAESARLPVLETLFDSGGKLNEQVLRKAAGNFHDGPNIVKALIVRIGSTSMLVDAFGKMMVMAAGNIWHGPDVMRILLHQSRGKGIKIVEEVLLGLNGTSGNRILALLLEDGRDIEITEKALQRILRCFEFDETIDTLLQRAYAIGTTQGILIAASRSDMHGDEMLSLLLSRPNPPPLTQDITKSVVANHTFGLEMIKLLEKYYGKVEISDEVMRECAAHGSLEAMEYIVTQQKDINISQEIFECCIRTGSWEVAQYILRRKGDIKVTQDHIDLAAGNPQADHYMLRFLSQELPAGRFTNETLKQALLGDCSALWYDAGTLKLLIRKGSITRLPADILMIALCNLRSLLEMVPEFEISEDLLEAAAMEKEQYDGNEGIKLLMNRNTHVQLTERILIATAANLSLDEMTLNTIVSSRGAIESITEEVQTTAALCGNLRFFKAISQVGEMTPTEVNWEEVARLRVAVKKGDHATVSRLLQTTGIEIDRLDLSGRTLLSTAAEFGHDEVAKLLLDAKADPNAKDSMGSAQEEKPPFGDEWKRIMASSQERTPLFWAVCEGHYETVEILADAGGNVNVVDSNGVSPLDFVRKWHCPRMEELLKRKSSEGAVGKQGDNEGT